MSKRLVAIRVCLAAVCAALAAHSAHALVFKGGPKVWHDAVVGIMVLHGDCAGGGHGCVFGDGTWVATAAHILIDEAEKGKHRSIGVPTVYSHAFGDVADAQIAAIDTESDVAILRVPWAGHPGLRLASDSRIRSMDGAFVAAWDCVVDATELNAPVRMTDQTLWLETVTPEKGRPEQIILQMGRTLRQGWSGTPLVLGEDDAVAGILNGTVRVTHPKDRTRHRDYAAACPARVIRQLARDAEDKADAAPPMDLQPFVKRESSHEAFGHAIKAAKARLQDNWEVAFAEAEAFLRLRPESPGAHRSLAGPASKLDKNDIAREHYQKALELAPHSWRSHSSYAVFLQETGENDEAVAEARKAVELLPDGVLPLVLLAGVLQVKGDQKEAETVIRRALKLEPNDAFTWYVLSILLGERGKTKDALNAARKALSLDPGSKQFRYGLADALATAGKLDEAEKQFKACLEAAPESPVLWFAFAEFLAEHRPKRRAEALAAVKKAIALNTAGKIPMEKLEKLREDIRKRSPGKDAAGKE